MCQVLKKTPLDRWLSGHNGDAQRMRWLFRLLLMFFDKNGRPRMNLDPLYPYQQKNARRLLGLLKDKGAACDRSEMGTGKTYTAAVVARELGLCPVVVVCPKSTISNWKEVFDQVGAPYHYFISNYEKFRLGKHPALYQPHISWSRSRLLLIIFDEAHKLRARKSQQTKMLIEAKKAGHKVLLLSATLVQSPLDISAIGYALGLFTSPKSWWSYARRFGGVLNLAGYYDWNNNPDSLLELNKEFDSRGVRTRICELDYELPCVNSVELVDVSCPSLRTIYNKLQAEALEKGDEAAYNAASLVARGKAREAAEKAKIPWLQTQAEELVKEGYSVVVFVNYVASMQDIGWSGMGGKLGPSRVTGGQGQQTRDREISFFQTNSTKILLANIKAGGIGLSLHDTTGNHPRVSLISPPESAIDLLQALGRIRRMGMLSSATNRIIYASDSVERQVFNKVRTKLNHLATLNDGDLEYEL